MDNDIPVHISAKDVVAVISDAYDDVTCLDNGMQKDDYSVTDWLSGSSPGSK